MCYIQYCSFSGGGGADDVLVKSPLIKKIIKDVNLMCISFSVKYPQIIWESRISLSGTIVNMYTYPFNPQLVIKTNKKS